MRVLPAGHVAIPRARLDLTKALIALRQYEEAGAEVTKAQAEFLAESPSGESGSRIIGTKASRQ